MASSSFQYTRADSWSKLSPSSDFYYRPSAEILAGGFRIASVLPGRQGDPIQCRIQEVSLKDTGVRFIALSYCWNSTTAEEIIWVDGRPLKVTSNLYAALRNARATTTVVNLWIDQICVDQQNIIDRNEQVGKMGAIFRAASGVIVWLGQEGHGTAAAMELPKRIRRFWPSLAQNPGELTDSSKTPPECPVWGEGAWPAFIMLLTRPWFRRLWIIQEIVCARDIVVTCGNATAFWDDFVQLVQIIEARHHPSLRASQTLGSGKTAAQYISFMEELRAITEQGTKQAVKDYANEESMVPYVLTAAKDCEATDHRDKLFAFHHIVRLWNRPDYGMDIAMLYKLFATQYLQRIAYAISEYSCDEVTLSRRQMDFICSAGICNQQLQLPSWTPDWSLPWKAQPLWLDNTCYSAGGNDIKEIAPVTELDADGTPSFRLPLTVKLFDKVLAVGSEGLKITETGPQALAEALRAWLFQSMSLLHVHRRRPSVHNEQHVAIARTITADQDRGKKLSVEDVVKRYDALLEFLRRSDDDTSPVNREELLEEERLHLAFANFLRGRVFFITEKGHFGLAQEGLIYGDSIAVVQGAPIPLIMRPMAGSGPQSNDYRLLCEAFVLGIMDGEAWQDQYVPIEEVQLV
ncbi:Heterokaryon incompatibility protein 6, OR allele [Pseudocercospora fuligena]|uniref:Heterokaryon incompatibility protein 6, OR allele n=1 Tax=Pseudocercospora fuligena TaxID=685502 RepID=A0A8H6VIP3_9PEZI|nr:Heterokaryon incompatibility protein 6, OR allele [Pseudocercospora fuligena]